uniref:Uncharacterized protein n=1 Tax=Setaria viridis TaxID=4556 RepID=A0A4U6TNV8_SETVI|nr:hypothetical protein SEVIR_7G098450v2 [Setaria viridis]
MVYMLVTRGRAREEKEAVRSREKKRIFTKI